MKEKLNKVIEKAKECLEDAHFLMKDKRYEAAVNRAYYAMFTAIQGLLLNKDILVKTHSGAKTKFHEVFLKPNLLPLQLGKIFEDALALRQEADYEFDIEITETDAKQTVNDADTFINAVIAFLQKND